MSAEPLEIETSTEPLIFGLEAMGAMFHRSRQTMARWIRTENFPAGQLPNGTYCTSPALINEWLRSRAPGPEKAQ